MGGDYSIDMETFVKDLALEDLSLPAGKIWMKVVDHFKAINPNFAGLTKEQMTSLVYNTRRDNIGGDAVRKVEAEYSGSTKSAFLRKSLLFHSELPNDMYFCRLYMHIEETFSCYFPLVLYCVT